MNQAFLEALKVKSQAIQATRVNAKPVPGKVYAITGNGDNNMASGKPIDQCEVKDIDPVINPDNRIQVTDSRSTVEIEIITERNRIDLFFQHKPGNSIRGLLKNQGFRFRPTDNAWYHQDNAGNRAFAEDFESLGFRVLHRGKSDQQSTPDAFETYKQQCAELCEALDLDPADLAIEAVKHFYAHTFLK